MFKGIHIKSYKESARFEKIENLPIPNEVTIFNSQHIGAPAKFIIKKGDMVSRGQIIAEALGGCSVNMHSPIGGKVKEIKKYSRSDGIFCEAAVITKDGDQEALLLEPLTEISPETIRARVNEAGIVGMGGAGFPTHVKLDPPKKINTAFLNGCECEPYLTADERLMYEHADKIMRGFYLAILAVGASEGIVGIENDKPDAIRVMKMASSAYPEITIKVLEKIYPQGYEKMLVKEALGKEIPSGGLPHDIAVSIHNVGTCLAIAEAVDEGKVLIERVLTISGTQMISPVNVKAPIGQNIAEMLGYYQIDKTDELLLLSGGPMMGLALDTMDMPIIKTTSGILVNKASSFEEEPCVKCGKCVEVCPMSLVPQDMNRMCDGQDWLAMSEAGLKDCMECGCCTYSCPSKISLTYKFKTAKRKL